jgi:hypothetical protein
MVAVLLKQPLKAGSQSLPLRYDENVVNRITPYKKGSRYPNRTPTSHTDGQVVNTLRHIMRSANRNALCFSCSPGPNQIDSNRVP